MNIDDCIDHFDETGDPYFKCYDASNMTIQLEVLFKMPSHNKIYTKEMVDGSYQIITYFDGVDTWQID